MKILGIYQGNGGSYHRVKLPLEQLYKEKEKLNPNLKIVIEKEITEKIIDDNRPDIILIHWTSPVSIPQLSLWKAKYNFKVIADIDDTWQVDDKKNKELMISVFQSKNLVLFADYVTCTNQIIAQEITKLNKNTFIIPNYIPKEFIIKKDWSNKTKINIGVYGSISHYSNWKSINYVLQNVKTELISKINFVLIGYQDTEKWNEIKEMFTINLNNVNIEPTLISAVNPEKSIEQLNNLDVILCPSSESFSFFARSNLKIHEATSKGVIPLVGHSYYEKDKNNRIFSFISSYEIRRIVNSFFGQDERKYLNSQIEKVESFTELYDYFESATKIRYQLYNRLVNASQRELDNQPDVNLYSIVYDSTKQIAEYNYYFNHVNTVSAKSYLFEYNPMIFLNSYSERNKYLGIFSWKFGLKTGFYKKLIHRAINKELSSNKPTDILIFCKPIKNYLTESEKSHPGILRILAKLCSKLNLTLSEPTHVVYSNFFIAKGDVYKEYIETVIKPAIKILDTDEELKSLVWQDSKYSSSLTTGELLKYTGLNYYTFHTFVLERLFSIWLENNKNKFTIKTFY